MDYTLEVHALGKQYGTMHAVRDLSFQIAPGEIFALIGPNGAGKSTSLRMIATVLSPTSGSITVCGLSDQEKIREHISYLPEEAGAYKNLTGKAYLHFMAALFSSDAQTIRTYVTTAEHMCGLGTRLDDKIKTYSKGMTRKLLLARTVMTNPKLAILDEPTSGLDILNAMQIRNNIKELSSRGMSVLLSSHNMLEIEFLSHRVGILNRGTLCAIGTPKELKQQYNAANLEEVFMAITKQ